MASQVEAREKLEVGDDGPVGRGYDGWKRAKVERGLAQARDRSAMIPADEVLRGFRMIVKINVAIGQRYVVA